MTKFFTFIANVFKAVPASYWKYIGIVILCLVIGMRFQSCIHHCPKCPEFKGSSKDTVIKVIYATDTSKGKVGGDSIKVVPKITSSFKKQIKPEIKPNISPTLPVDTVPVIIETKDTQYCYSAEWKENDGSVIGVTGCSLMLPQEKPKDFTFDHKYFPAPKVEKTITVKDTFLMPARSWDLVIGAGGGYSPNLGADNFKDVFRQGQFRVSVGVYFGKSLLSSSKP